METIAFFFGAIGALGGAVAVVSLRNPFYSVLALIVHLVFLAGIFLLLMAQFLAAALIVVYAGAVMVLYVFVAAYVGGIEEPKWDSSPELKVVGPILAIALFVVISIAILGSGLSALGSPGPDDVPSGFGTPEAIGHLMLEDFLVAFEAASLLLLIAAVAAIVLAGRRRDERRSLTQERKGLVGADEEANAATAGRGEGA
ncbi:MAG TPA: NADH-quinone oxidoreductase subunit J [Solirubrobacterales bacterium]|nr:NADH-quinone oxidoreductase subunit J [Solirubrobacterales bacterium]